jgi:carboxynorspermidine decarboxylase
VNLDDLHESPCYVVDLGRLRQNLEILADVQERSGCKILLALKGFAMWRLFPLISEYLSGFATSSPHETQLAHEFGAGEIHAYAPAYAPADLQAIVGAADHVVFNSLSQWASLRGIIDAAPRPIQCGLRINPEHSEVKTALYDPCAPSSRLGVTRAAWTQEASQGLTGLHFHNLCELGADALERTLEAVEARFPEALRTVSWVNLGGGHHITRPGYDVNALVRLLQDFKRRHQVEVYLEPGEAIALNTGVLISEVLDIVHNGGPIAILDTSATAHMPDVLEMPYRPQIRGAAEPGVKPHTYRLGGLTCLAGDVIGDYAFDEHLRPGSRLVFEDMAHYTMVKNTTFNGVRLPSIATYEPKTQKFEVVRRFTYDDYKSRLS